MPQRIDEQIGPIAAIESEFHFFEVGREMLWADSMPCSHDAALEKRERSFNGVRMNVSHDVDFSAVIDGFVLALRPRFYGSRIGRKFIGDNHVHSRI